MADTARQVASVYRIDVANQLADYMKNTGRVVHSLICDSNGLRSDAGMQYGLDWGLTSRFPCFGTSLTGARGYRPLYQVGGSSSTAYARYTDNDNPTASGGQQNYIRATGCTWVDATKTLTGTFTNYSGRAGDLVGAYVGSVGPYVCTVVSGNATTIVLSASDAITGGGVANVTVEIAPKSGGTMFSGSQFPQAYSDAWNMPNWWRPLGAQPVYLASGTVFLNAQQTWYYKKLPLSPVGRLRHSMIYLGGGGAGGGVLYAYHFTPPSPGSQIGNAAYTAAAAAGTLSRASITASASDRSSGGDGVLWGTAQIVGDTGPLCHMFMHADNPDQTYGCAVSPFMSCGGQSAYDAAMTLAFCSDTTIDNYLKSLCDQADANFGATGPRRVCIWIMMGHNDLGETVTDYNGGGYASYTANGYKNNLTYIVNRLRARWDATYGAGTSASELYFALVPSHPVSDTVSSSPTTPPTVADMADRQAWYQRYVGAAAELANSLPLAFAVDLYSLLGPNPATKFNSAAWYASTSDYIHLNAAGYRFIGAELASAIDARATRVGGGSIVMKPRTANRLGRIF